MNLLLVQRKLIFSTVDIYVSLTDMSDINVMNAFVAVYVSFAYIYAFIVMIYNIHNLHCSLEFYFMYMWLGK